MGELRIRIKFGEHEFEGEGPVESVERRVEAFQHMIAPPTPPPPAPESGPIASEEKPAESPENTVLADEEPAQTDETAMQVEQKTAPPEESPLPPPLRLEQIMHMRGTILSLSVQARLPDAILVILLGQRNFRRNESVSGIEIMQGLRDSGFRVLRVDTLLTKFSRLGSVIVMGEHRRRRYRLSISGAVQAEQIARALAALTEIST